MIVCFRFQKSAGVNTRIYTISSFVTNNMHNSLNTKRFRSVCSY